MRPPGITGDPADVLIAPQSRYHIVRPLGSDRRVVRYLVLSRAQANLAMARRRLQQIESGLIV